MTPQSDIDEVRQIEAGTAPTRFARGWHCLGLTRELGDGKPHTVNAFGQRLVVFRSQDGRLNVLDGYRRHMGAICRRVRSRATRSPARSMTGGGRRRPL